MITSGIPLQEDKTMEVKLFYDGDQLLVEHNAEPLFCYEVRDRQHAIELVRDTQESYKRIFAKRAEITVK
jgi:hypothetical protein